MSNSNSNSNSLTTQEKKILSNLIEKTLMNVTYNKKTKEDLFIIREIICSGVAREDIRMYELDEYL